MQAQKGASTVVDRVKEEAGFGGGADWFAEWVRHSAVEGGKRVKTGAEVAKRDHYENVNGISLEKQQSGESEGDQSLGKTLSLMGTAVS